MEEMNTFEHFDVVSDDSDHYFVGSSDGKCFSDSKSGVYKIIMREWRTLEQNLPESIYVRVYERRIDLMRAVIVGAAGTPYHDGLFFFDIAFPSDYPNNPPMLHFHSFGIELNPNLYANGRVCLSLLNTWHGRRREMWDPSRSTLLQVLLSIQGLVLNEKPFFNEPSHDAWRRFVFESKSRAFNQRVFALTCNSSLYLLRRPLNNFEPFVRAHFRQRAFAILTACNDYENEGVRSRQFKMWMKVKYPVVVEAFRRNGASLDRFIQQLELQRVQVENKSCDQSEQSKNKTNGIFKKAVEKIKRALRWKNSERKEKKHRSHISV